MDRGVRDGCGFGCALEALAQHLLELADDPLAAFEHARPDTEGVDEHQVRGGGLLGDDLPEARKCGAQLLAPVVGLAVGAADAFGGHPRDQIVGREEALFLAGEEFVEGAARDAGERHELPDRRVRVAVLCDGGDHRAL